MANENLNEKLLKEMYNDIRAAEIRNIKTQKMDDKQMVNAIERYVFKKVEKEVQENED